jgi:hypothetical protein
VIAFSHFLAEPEVSELSLKVKTSSATMRYTPPQVVPTESLTCSLE